MLDNIGIIVDSEKAYREYAEANNLSVDSLTDAEKKQAFLSATMISAKRKIELLGDEVLTTQDKIDVFSASMSNLSSAIGDNLGWITKIGVGMAGVADRVAGAIQNTSALESAEKALIFQQERKLTLEEKIKTANALSVAMHKIGITEASNKIQQLKEEIAVLKKADTTLKQEEETKRRNLELEKQVKDALDATNVSKIESVKILLEALKSEAETAINKEAHNEAIKTQIALLNTLRGIEDSSMAMEKEVKKALEATVIARIEATRALIAQLEADKKASSEKDKHTEAINTQKEALDLLLNPLDKVVDTYEEWFAVQDKTFDKNKQMAEWIAKLTEEEYALADSLGLVKKTQAELNAESAIKSTTVSVF
jgi:hypothetical protein